jgi:hypothetical protein
MSCLLAYHLAEVVFS